MKKLIERVNTIEELFIGYALLAIAIVATIQVVLRYTLGIAYDWVDEGSRYMTVLITFVGAGICVRCGSHFSMDALIQYSPNRLKHLLKFLANLVSGLVMLVVFYYAWIQISRLQHFGASTPSIRIPMFIPYLPIGVFTGVIALRFLIEAGRHAVALARNTPFGTQQGGGH